MPANRFELLATWYLRFNGYFTIPSFTVHGDYKKRPGGTDADVLAVRFPYSSEYQKNFVFERDEELISENQLDFVICEVKSGRCDINVDTWRNPGRENVEYAIRWMGFIPIGNEIAKLAKQVYQEGIGQLKDQKITVRFLCIGSEENTDLSKTLPRVTQICHDRVIKYLQRRFTTGCFKIQRNHWDKEIQQFAKLCNKKGVGHLKLKKWAKNEKKPKKS